MTPDTLLDWCYMALIAALGLFLLAGSIALVCLAVSAVKDALDATRRE